MENLSAASKLANQVQFHLKIYLILSLYVRMFLILNIDICPLLVRIDCVDVKPAWKLHVYFLEWKTHLFVLNLVPSKLEIAIKGFEIPKFSGRACLQTSLKEGD